MRMTVAAELVPKVIEGRTRLRSKAGKVSPIPEEGNQFNLSEKKRTINRPIQKAGMATPIRPMTVETLSTKVYCFLADKIPMGIPITVAINIALAAKIIVNMEVFA